MYRKAHLLKENKRRTRPTYLLFFDTETETVEKTDEYERQILRFGYALFWRRRTAEEESDTVKVHRFEKEKEIADIIEGYTYPKTTLYVIADNIFYDIAATNLHYHLQTRGWELQSLYVQNKTVIIRLEKGNRKIVLLNNRNLFDDELAKWGKAIGIEKYEVDWNNPDLDILEQRCRNEVQIMYELHKAWLGILDEEDLGDWKVTVASQAFTAYRHAFMNTDIHIHTDQEATEAERLAYKGGLVKVMRVGDFSGETVRLLDVNSMYPYVMHEKEYPTKLVGKHPRPSLKALEELIGRFAVIADVLIEPDRPVFPRRIGGICYYPMYPFRTMLCTPELAYLLERERIREVYRIFCYKTGKIFTDYVDYFYAKRLTAKAEGKDALATMYKLFLNSLYGKFGARAISFQRAPEFDDLADFDGEVKDCTEDKQRPVIFWGDKAYIEVDEGEAYNAFAAIAAHVTSYARMHLSSLIEKAGWRNVYLCDTDGFIVNEEGYHALEKEITEDVLGKLKIAGEGRDCIVKGRKFYRLAGKWKIKGGTYIGEIDGDFCFVRDIWPTFRSTFRGKHKDGVIIERKRLEMSGILHDGIPDADGFVYPYTERIEGDTDPLALA